MSDKPEIACYEVKAQAAPVTARFFVQECIADAYASELQERHQVVSVTPLVRLSSVTADKARIAELEEFAREIIKQYPNPDITHEQFRMHACRHAAAVIEQDCEGGTP